MENVAENVPKNILVIDRPKRGGLHLASSKFFILQIILINLYLYN